MSRVQIETTIKIDIDIPTAAKWFANLPDDEMADFLIRVAAEANAWPVDTDTQWYYLGGHLKNCKCATEEVREMLRRWVYWMDRSEHA